MKISRQKVNEAMDGLVKYGLAEVTRVDERGEKFYRLLCPPDEIEAILAELQREKASNN